jgi:hypothetical protein
MASLELTQVYLEKEQKQALQRRAQAKGTKLAEEIRHAVDAYLAGVTAEDLELLDAATQEAKKHLDAMVMELDRVNRKLDTAFAEMERIHGSRPSAETGDAS